MSNLNDYKKAAQELATPQHKDTTLDDLLGKYIYLPYPEYNMGLLPDEQGYDVLMYHRNAQFEVDYEEAKQALLQWRDKAVVEARNKAIDDVKLMGYGYDDGTGFVLTITYADLAKLKETPNED